MNEHETHTVRRSPIPEDHTTAPTGWHEEVTPQRAKPRLRTIEIVFLSSLAFFVLAAGGAALLFFSGTNTVSTKNVAINVAGPTSIRAGDTLTLQIVVTNKNTVPMELTDLVVEYPSGTRSEPDVSVELPRVRESLGTIDPGASVNRTERSVIFGTAGTVATVKISVEYRVPSSNAIFHSETMYSVPVSASPASINVSSLSEVVSGQSVSMTVTVASNVQDPLSKMLLVATYPPGFSFTSATPKPISGSTVWNLGDIEPSGKRTITITGTFTGDDGDKRVMHFTAGTASATAVNTIAAPLATADTEVTVARPFVAASLALDGDQAATHVIRRGVPVRVDVAWQNNLPVPISNLEIDVKLDGAILNRQSVAAPKGFFRSADNTVVFSTETDPTYASIPAGASGVASFTFSTMPPGLGVYRNPSVGISVTVTGRRLSDANVPETITSSAQATAEVATDLALNSTLSRTGPFTNTGPIPPKADHETTYTVTWTLANSQNAVANASVSATLPSYVRFMNQVTGGEPVTYNAVGGIVTWSAGDLAEGTVRTVSFQIGVTPSLSQVGNAPTIVADQRAAALDRFTGGQIEVTALPITTQTGTTLQMGAVVP